MTQKNNPNGFTLIEVIVSLAIFSIISMSLYSLLYSSLTTTTSSDVLFNATQLSQKYIEELNIIRFKEIEDTYTLDDDGNYYKQFQDSDFDIELKVSKIEDFNYVYNNFDDSHISSLNWDYELELNDTQQRTLEITYNNDYIYINENSQPQITKHTQYNNIKIVCSGNDNYSNHLINISNNTSEPVNIYIIQDGSTSTNVNILSTNGNFNRFLISDTTNYTPTNIYETQVTISLKDKIITTMTSTIISK